MKSLLIAFATLIAAILLPSVSHAYFEASLSGPHVDFAKPTHILVSGRGQDLGRQPQLAALGLAARLRQTNPQDQVVLLSVFEDPTNRQDLEAKGVIIVKTNESVSFTTSSILPELLKFSKIESLQFLGHNSPTLGTQSDGPGARFDFRDPRMAKLAGHFTADAYIFIHGCNAGWVIAPMLSKLLKLPVAGAMTGTHFERLNEDGHFYVADAGGVPNLNWAKANSESFDADRACANGGCLRMRPANSAYNGHWGNLTAGGLGFYKFFCETVSTAACERAMAKALMNWVSVKNLNRASLRADFIEAAKDFICPSSKDRALSRQCSQAMDAALAGGKKTYSSFLAGPAIQCDFKSCEVHFACTSTGGPAGIGSCSVTRTNADLPTTQVEEFLAYVRGFDQMTAAK